MLDPNSLTRATVQEILAHPWLQTSKTPTVTPTSTLSTRTRKANVIYSISEALEIRDALIESTCECTCSCHRTSGERKDSVITKHCADCDEILANGPAKMHGISRNSSGYGSECGSMLFTPRVSLVDGTVTLDSERKTSNHYRTSFSKSPIPPVPQILELEDEELIFV